MQAYIGTLHTQHLSLTQYPAESAAQAFAHPLICFGYHVRSQSYAIDSSPESNIVPQRYDPINPLMHSLPHNVH